MNFELLLFMCINIIQLAIHVSCTDEISVIKRVFCMMPIIAKSKFMSNEPRLIGH